jgi:hypothetical protein
MRDQATRHQQCDKQQDVLLSDSSGDKGAERREEADMQSDDDEQFLSVELPNALRRIRARAEVNDDFARTLLFDGFHYDGPHADAGSSHAQVLQALDICLRVAAVEAKEHMETTREFLKEFDLK